MVRHVLLVDGDRRYLCALSALLRASGLTVSEAYDMQSGLISLLSDKPDALVVDTVLPDHDGFGFLIRARAEHALDALPVLFTSSRGRAVEGAKAQALGALGVLTKPFGPDAILAQLGVGA
jgi:DNA-binding response OmpR family regulator